jgi:peptidoglycan hydrolase-like protein with peptidoglycan-binding domain
MAPAPPSPLGCLLERFAAESGPDIIDGRIRPGDRVRTAVKGADSLVGRVVRVSDHHPLSHVLIAPEGGGPHVEAPVRMVRHDTPERHGAEMRRRQIETMGQAVLPMQKPPVGEDFNPGEARGFGGKWIESAGKLANLSKEGHPNVLDDDELDAMGFGQIARMSKQLKAKRKSQPMGPKLKKSERKALFQAVATFAGLDAPIPAPLLAGLELALAQEDFRPEELLSLRGIARTRTVVEALLEGFSVGVAGPGETPQQSAVLGAQQVKQAQADLAAWNASLHPRGTGGKFAYKGTSSKRAHVGSSKSSSSTKGYGAYVGLGAHGALVASVQRQLGIKSDGIYGTQTRQAVMNYQKQHGLRVDGIIGRQTLASLRGQTGASKITPGPISSASATITRHSTSSAAKAAQSKARARAAKRAKTKTTIGGGVVIGRLHP